MTRGYTKAMDTHSTDQAGLVSPEAGPPSPALPAEDTGPMLPEAQTARGATGMAVPAPEPRDTSEVSILQDLHARAAGYATRARGPGTLRTYRSA